MANLDASRLRQVQLDPAIFLSTTAGTMFQAMSEACRQETGHALEVFEWGGYRDDVLTNAMADDPVKFHTAAGVHLQRHPNGSHEDGDHVDIRFSQNDGTVVGKWLRGGGGIRFGFHPDTISGDRAHWAFVATSVASLISTLLIGKRKRPMYLAGDTGGVGYLVTDNGKISLTRQEYILFFRLINADQSQSPLNQGSTWPVLFNPIEVNLIDNALARANHSGLDSPVDTVGITNAVTEAVTAAIAAAGAHADTDQVAQASAAAAVEAITEHFVPPQDPEDSIPLNRR